MTIYRDIIISTFEAQQNNFDYLDSLRAAKALKRFGKDGTQMFDLIKLIFKGRLNISKNLKLGKLVTLKDSYIEYEGVFKEKQKWYDHKTKTTKEKNEHEVLIEIDLQEHKIVCNIIFIDTGEIRQWHWRPE